MILTKLLLPLPYRHYTTPVSTFAPNLKLVSSSTVAITAAAINATVSSDLAFCSIREFCSQRRKSYEFTFSKTSASKELESCINLNPAFYNYQARERVLLAFGLREQISSNVLNSVKLQVHI